MVVYSHFSFFRILCFLHFAFIHLLYDFLCSSSFQYNMVVSDLFLSFLSLVRPVKDPQIMFSLIHLHVASLDVFVGIQSSSS